MALEARAGGNAACKNHNHNPIRRRSEEAARNRPQHGALWAMGWGWAPWLYLRVGRCSPKARPVLGLAAVRERAGERRQPKLLKQRMRFLRVAVEFRKVLKNFPLRSHRSQRGTSAPRGRFGLHDDANHK